MWLFKRKSTIIKTPETPEALPTPLPIGTEPKPKPSSDHSDPDPSPAPAPAPDPINEAWPAKLGPPQYTGDLPPDFWPVLAKLSYDFRSQRIPNIRKTPEYKVLYDKWQAELTRAQDAASTDNATVEPLPIDCIYKV